jgi:MoxR-like ATPase
MISDLAEKVLFEVKRVIVGQDRFVERVLVALLAQGHLLVEGVPGLAKTLTVKTLARVLTSDFKRVQFTPDLMPSDLVGTRIYNQKTGDFATWKGPVFTNLLLADEINRAPAKVQSALLEVMEERQVSLGGETFPVPRPFLVMATQNPIETEGTYPLPEAQVDRFLMKVVVGYPTTVEEFSIVERMIAPPVDLRALVDAAQWEALTREVQRVYVDPLVIDFAVRLVAATRNLTGAGLPELAPYLNFGASPRGTLHLVAAARALAALNGRDYVLAADVQNLALDVLRHRLVLSYEALADRVGPDEILTRVLGAVPAPSVSTPKEGFLETRQTVR